MTADSAADAWVPRRAHRDTQDLILGGVAAGLARHLGVPVMWVRLGFVAATFAAGFGLLVYAGLWMAMPTDEGFAESSPGVESATRRGMRPGGRRRVLDLGPAVVLGVLAIGVVTLLSALTGNLLLIPAVVAVLGIALLWRQADEAQRQRWIDSSGRIDPFRAVFGDGGWASFGRVAAGLGLILVALILFALSSDSLSLARDVLVASLLGIVGLAIVVGPWIYRLAADLTAERGERVRTQERADLAAHLHDSVLQTLALIQKNAGDQATVARLARSQERDLRTWLFSTPAEESGTFAGQLRAVAAQLEDAHGISVDVVAVGDLDFSERTRPVVDAAREAITNAAKHSGVARVDVYAEAGPGGVDVFVRDRGAGFDLDGIGTDRLGVTRSILDRMERHGGRADIITAPGEGTEVRLHLPLDQEDS